MTNLVLADHQPRRDHDCLVEPADDRQPLVRVRWPLRPTTARRHSCRPGTAQADGK